VSGTAPSRSAPRVRARWLVSARYDIFFFIASAALVLAFASLHELIAATEAVRSLGVDANLAIYFLFTAFFDHPHIFQSFSRSHVDRAELERHRRLHTWGLAAFIVAGYAILAVGLERQMIVFAAFFGTWHIVRQHWGFIRLYKALNNDWDPLDARLETALYYIGMLAIVLVGYSDISRRTVVYGELTAPFFAVPEWIAYPSYYLFLALLGLYLLRQLSHVIGGRPLNLPKLLLMASAMGSHFYVHMVAALPFLATEAIETVYHDVQYQGFIRHYQKRRHGRGLALRFLLLAMLYGLLVGSLEVWALLQRSLRWVVEPFAMVVIYHYYADGKLWRTREAPELREALLGPQATDEKTSGASHEESP
jgi:hypothetical protein